jgi:transposase
VGIDVAKAHLDVAYFDDAGKAHHRQFENTLAGLAAARQWLPREDLHVCLEATGRYSRLAARVLFEQGATVSLLNPLTLRTFARMQREVCKTDKRDALHLARYAALYTPAAWTPADRAYEQLAAMRLRLEQLEAMHQQEQNRLQQETDPGLRACHESLLRTLGQQIQHWQSQIRSLIARQADLKTQSQLLCSIPGVAHKTACAVLALAGDLRRFDSSGALARFAGLCPRLHESGTSVRGRPTLCKMGHARLRRALYFPAITALRHNPILRALKERLAARGKTPMQILGAAMRKLLVLCYGVLKSGKPFDPGFAGRAT